MAASSSSPHLLPTNSSSKVAARPIPTPRHGPAVRIRSWRRFAASSSEVSLVPARLLRPPPRRRNTLREKASRPPPPLVVRHLVRPPCQDSPELGPLERQEQKADSLDAEPSSDLEKDSVISGGQSAYGSGVVASDSKLEELDPIGDDETRSGLAFGVYKASEGSVMEFEVREDEIINWSEASQNDGSGGLEPSMSSRARALAMGLESSVHVAPNSSDNSSWSHFAAAEGIGSSVLNGEVSVVQRNMPPWRNVAWTGFAALCGFCIVFVASKLIGSSNKVRLPRNLINMYKPEMKEDESDKGNLNVFRNGREFPDGLLRRPLLDRKELMSNIKKAQDSRNWFLLSSSFCRRDASIYDDTSIPEIRRNVAEVPTSEEGTLERYGTNEKYGIVIPQPIDSTVQEVSASYSCQSYFDEASDSSESNGISLSQDKIEQSMEQTVDLETGAQSMNMTEKDQGNIGEIEVPEPMYSNGKATSTDDRNSMIYSLEKEAQIGSADVHKSGRSGASTPASEFESKEQSGEICEKNIDPSKGIEPSVVFISEKPMLNAKDNAHEFSTNLVSEPSNSLSISSSELTKKQTSVDPNASDLNGIQEIKATRNLVNVAHNASIVGAEACKTPVSETMTATSLHRNKEDAEDLRTQNMQSGQGQEPYISSGKGKQASLSAENEHKERTLHNKTQTRMETDQTRILNNSSTPSFFVSQEESSQHTFAEVSLSEKKERKRAKAQLQKKKGKLQKEVYNDKQTETEQSEQGKPGTETMDDPTNRVQKTKRVRKKGQKKVQNERERVAALNDVQNSSMLDQKNNSQLVKKARRKNPKNKFEDAQAREENTETTNVITSPDNATTDNKKPQSVADSYVETIFKG